MGNRCVYNCPSEFPYPVQAGPFVDAKLCYTEEGFANQGQGTANSWCARTPGKNSDIQQQIKDGQGKPCEY